MGNLVIQNPVASSSILIANMALCGLPFLAGFYSKDLILEYVLTGGFNALIVVLIILAVGLTAIYSIRFSIAVIWGPSHYSPLFNPDDNSSTVVPIIVIALISTIIGSSILWLIPVQAAPLFIPLSCKLGPIIIVVVGLITGLFISANRSVKTAFMFNLHFTNYASCLI